ncbi:MAG: hypothetical protein KAQ68_04675 [Clostridiales bacterium]|nr:hypothetical protein [Clostridiales bacterium]
MAKGFYEVTTDASNSYTLIITLIGNETTEIPQDQQDLKLLIDETNIILKDAVFIPNKRKNKYFSQLLSIAQKGLSSEDAKPENATKSLRKLREKIMIKEGEMIKKDHTKSLSTLAWSATGIAAVLACVFWFMENDVIKLAKGNFLSYFYFSPYLFVFTGAMVGVWLYYIANKDKSEFKDIIVIYKAKLNLVSQLFVVGVSSIVFLLFINIGVVTLEIGGFSDNKLMETVHLQLPLGIILGLAGNKLATALSTKANSLFDEIITTVKTVEKDGEEEAIMIDDNEEPSKTNKTITTTTKIIRRVRK